MELVNVKYINHEEQSFFKKSLKNVPLYEDIKDLKPVIVDDILNLQPEEENFDLLKRYVVHDKFSLVPISRQKPGGKRDYSEFPSRVILELTSKCNLKCVMCPRNALNRAEIHMPKELIFRCIDEVDKYGVDGVWLYYIGEALMHPDFMEIMEYCQHKKNLGSLWISTNGQDLTNANMDMLVNSNLTFINYSLNAMSSESLRVISPGSNYTFSVSNLEKLLEKKRKYKKMGKTPWIRVQMIDQLEVVNELDKFLVEYSQRAEILSINVLEAFSQNVSKIVDYAKKRKRKKKTRCDRMLRGDCYIFSDGGVTMCSADFNHEMNIGNVTDSSIKEIWDGEAFEKYKLLNQSGHLDEIPICRECLDYDL